MMYFSIKIKESIRFYYKTSNMFQTFGYRNYVMYFMKHIMFLARLCPPILDTFTNSFNISSLLWGKKHMAQFNVFCYSIHCVF